MDALHFVLHAAQELSLVGFGQVPGLQQLHEAQDGRQWISNLVGDARREPSDAGQLLAADQLVLGGVQLPRGALELGQASLQGFAVGAQVARHAIEADGQTRDLGGARDRGRAAERARRRAARMRE